MVHENTSMSVTVARPAEACTPLENDVRGKVVLVRRGSCPFVKKAEEVSA
jgi:cytochrome oxidase assembly protein ShyY1